MVWLRSIRDMSCRLAMKRSWIPIGLGLVVLLGFTVLDRLQVALAAMHRSGDVSPYFARIAAPASLWQPQLAWDRVRAWRDWDADRLAADIGGQVISPYLGTATYALAGSVLVTVPITGLLVCLACVTAQRPRVRANPDASPQPASTSRDLALVWLADAAVVPALLYGLLAVAQNAAALGCVNGGCMSARPALATMVRVLPHRA